MMKKIPHLFFIVGIIYSLSILLVGCLDLSSQSTEPFIEKVTEEGDSSNTSVYNPALIITNAVLVNRLEDGDFLKGVAYVSNSQWAYSSEASKKTLVELIKPLGVTWISVIPICYQAKTNSINIDCPQDKYRPDDVDIERVIDFAHQIGLKVMLTPHIHLNDPSGSWRGEIGFGNNEADWSQWFENYTSFIIHYADMAEKHQVDYFVIGSEYEMTSHREAEWRKVVAAVRNIYSGPVTYSANYGEEAEHTVQWWDSLDAIAIDAYYPLTAKNDPTAEELVEAWQPITIRLENLSRKWDRPIIFTEIGYQSKDGSNTRPWDSELSSVIDHQEQADAYAAVFEAFADKSWWNGVFWWAWDNNPVQGGLANDDYEIHGKPAEDVLRTYYGRELEPTPLPTVELLVNEAVNELIYSDTLLNGWQDYSYFGEFNFSSKDVVAEGASSIKISLDPWGGICWAHKGIETDPYQWIEFYINYGDDTQRKLMMSGYGKDGEELYYQLNITEPVYYPDGMIMPQTWHLIKIPLHDIGLDNQVITKICITDGSGDGQKYFWLDSIRLLAASDL